MQDATDIQGKINFLATMYVAIAETITKIRLPA